MSTEDDAVLLGLQSFNTYVEATCLMAQPLWLLLAL
jgi:hypothetical protein